MSKDLANPNQEFDTREIERPNSVKLSMPWELYELLQWENDDGLQWSYIDKDRVLVKRIPKDGGSTGDTIPQGMFEQQSSKPPETIPIEQPIKEVDIEVIDE